MYRPVGRYGACMLAARICLVANEYCVSRAPYMLGVDWFSPTPLGPLPARSLCLHAPIPFSSHPGYFGKVGMRHFHLTTQSAYCPTVNLDKLWSLVSEQVCAWFHRCLKSLQCCLCACLLSRGSLPCRYHLLACYGLQPCIAIACRQTGAALAPRLGA